MVRFILGALFALVGSLGITVSTVLLVLSIVGVIAQGALAYGAMFAVCLALLALGYAFEHKARIEHAEAAREEREAQTYAAVARAIGSLAIR